MEYVRISSQIVQRCSNWHYKSDELLFRILKNIILIKLLFIFPKLRNEPSPEQSLRRELEDTPFLLHLSYPGPEFTDSLPQEPGVLVPVDTQVESYSCKHKYQSVLSTEQQS